MPEGVRQRDADDLAGTVMDVNSVPSTPGIQRMAVAARDLLSQSASGGDIYRFAADLAVVNVEGATAAGVTLVRGSRGGRLEIRGETVEDVARAGELQNECQEGPCLEAVWDEPVVHSRDLDDEPRFPLWAGRTVEETKIRSALSLRLFTNETTLGALCIYSSQPAAFGPSSIEDGLALAAHIAVAVAEAASITQLEQALGTRTVIAQATGILMERYSIPPAAAFALLGRASSNAEAKLRTLATELVETGTLRGISE